LALDGGEQRVVVSLGSAQTILSTEDEQRLKDAVAAAQSGSSEGDAANVQPKAAPETGAVIDSPATVPH
jgi:hypothetical protein